MTGEPIVVGQPHRGVGLKRLFDQRENFWQGLVEIAAGGERTRQTIQGNCALFAAALGLLAFAQLRSEMSDDNRDNEIRTEHHEVMEMRDVKGEARRNEQKIPEQRAEPCQKECRPTA